MEPNAPILLCFALKDESAALSPSLTTRADVRVLHTGIGAKNAASAARQALEAGAPRWVLTCGFAGGLNPDLRCGQVLFSADPGSDLEKALRAAGAIPGRFRHSDRVLVSAEEKRELRRSTGDDAVEMESSVIRHLAEERGIPSATVRVISDTASENLPLDFNALMDSEQKISLRNLLEAVGRSPWKVGALMRLQRQTASAARELAAVLERVIPP